jgi:hypothetical protein
MCGDTVVTNTPMFIHQSTQIIQIHVSNLMLRYVCYREIRWHDYVLHYILKYIPTYVRMDWPSTTTHQTHSKGPKYFYQNFCGHQQHPYLQYPCFWWYCVHYKNGFIFKVIHILNAMLIPPTPLNTPKSTFLVIFSPKIIFLKLHTSNPCETTLKMKFWKNNFWPKISFHPLPGHGKRCPPAKGKLAGGQMDLCPG